MFLRKKFGLYLAICRKCDVLEGVELLLFYYYMWAICLFQHFLIPDFQVMSVNRKKAILMNFKRPKWPMKLNSRLHLKMFSSLRKTNQNKMSHLVAKHFKTPPTWANPKWRARLSEGTTVSAE